MDWLAEHWETLLLIVSLVLNVLFPAAAAKIAVVMRRALEIMTQSIEDVGGAHVKQEISILTEKEGASVREAIRNAVAKVDPKPKHDAVRAKANKFRPGRALLRVGLDVLTRRLH